MSTPDQPTEQSIATFFESIDVEVRVRRLLREALEAMFPTRMFFVDAMPTDIENPRGVITRTYLFAAPFLPAMVQGPTPAEALACVLIVLSYKVRHQGPPRLEGEAVRWADELRALGVPVMSDDEIAKEWDTGKQPWFEPFEDEEKEKEAK